MSDSYKYSQVSGNGQVTNESAGVEVISAPGTGVTFYVEEVSLSVYEAAEGGGGICELRDTNGVVLHTVDVDFIKDIAIPHGSEGTQISYNSGLQLVVSGAAERQASVSAIVTGHLQTQS